MILSRCQWYRQWREMYYAYNASPVFGALGLEGPLGVAALLLPASVIVELSVEL